MIATRDKRTYVEGSSKEIALDLALIIATVRDSIVKDFNLSLDEANKVVEIAYNIGTMNNEERGNFLAQIGGNDGN